jgi:hypothetical protein
VLLAGYHISPLPYTTHIAVYDDTPNREHARSTPRGCTIPAVICSSSALPFNTKFFEFVHCIDALQRVLDPIAACRELVRVARRGYIECPRSWMEYLIDRKDHRWLVEDDDDELTFRPKSAPEMRALDWLRQHVGETADQPTVVARMRTGRTVYKVCFAWKGPFRARLVDGNVRKSEFASSRT